MILALILFILFPGSPSTGVAQSGQRGHQQISYESQHVSGILYSPSSRRVAQSGHRVPQQLSYESQQASGIYNFMSLHDLIINFVLYFFRFSS